MKLFVTSLFIFTTLWLSCNKASPPKALPQTKKAAFEARVEKQDQVRARLRLNAGKERMRKGELDVAQQAFEQSQTLDPTFSESYRMLATIYRRQEDPRACLQMTRYFELENRRDAMRDATLKAFCKPLP